MSSFDFLNCWLIIRVFGLSIAGIKQTKVLLRFWRQRKYQLDVWKGSEYASVMHILFLKKRFVNRYVKSISW